MKLVQTPLQDAMIVEPDVFGDERGFFLESWNGDRFAEAGLNLAFVQDNHSRSAKGVLRGMHFQNPEPQGKLVRVVSGAVWDAIVDLRQSSSTFAKWYGVKLSATNKRMLWVPPGFAHGFLTLEENTDFLYKCTSAYRPKNEHCLLWCDSEVGIKWPLSGMEPRLSVKDCEGKPLNQIPTFP